MTRRRRSRSRSRPRYRSRSRSPSRSRGGTRSRYRSRSRTASRSRSNSRNHGNRHRNDSPLNEAKASEAPPLIKAQVVEKNGEISCSIEQTNKIRISLGLKPLKIGKSKDDEVKERSLKLKEEEEQQQRQAELQAKIAKSKNKRELHEKLKGRSLGELLKDEAEASGGTALDWVEKSRKKEAENRPKALKDAERMAKALEEQEEIENSYSAVNLAGMKVSHGAEEFAEGENIVLTLKDKPILEDDDGEVLENVNMSEMDRIKDRQKRAKRAKQPVYSGYDDDEFQGPGTLDKPKILSHYDEEQKTGAKLVLDSSGGTNQQVLQRQMAVRERLHRNRGDKVKEDLSMDKTRAIAEYYTQEEMVQFTKPKKKRRKKQRRKDTSEEIPDVQELGNSNNDVEMKEADDVASAELVDDEEEDSDLRAALAQSRRLAIIKKQKKREKANISRAAEIAAAVEAARNSEMQVDTPKSTIVFSDATDFETRLRTAIEEKDRAKQASLEAERRRANRLKDEDEQKSSAMEVDVSEEVNNDVPPTKEENEEEWGQEQPLVSGGMAAALAVLQSTGDLRNREVPRQAGRANDRRDKEGSFVKDGVKIEYKDEFGRVLTKKEAFRLLSYKFHGQKPGKKKMEQRLKMLKEELKMDKMLSGEGSLATMKALERQQKLSGQAHVMLSGNAGTSANNK